MTKLILTVSVGSVDCKGELANIIKIIIMREGETLYKLQRKLKETKSKRNKGYLKLQN